MSFLTFKVKIFNKLYYLYTYIIVNYVIIINYKRKKKIIYSLKLLRAKKGYYL